MSLWRVSDRILHRRVFGCLGVFQWDEEGQVYGGFSSFNKEKRKCDFTQKITGPGNCQGRTFGDTIWTILSEN